MNKFLNYYKIDLALFTLTIVTPRMMKYNDSEERPPIMKMLHPLFH